MIEWIGSPNYTEARKPITKVIVHWIVGHLQAADAVFSNPNSQVSAHYGIEGKEVHQYVNEDDTAWHAGNWDVNLESVGIEHAGGPNLPIAEETYITSSRLIRDICKRYDIPIDSKHIIPHKEIVATQCPGTLDVERLIKMANENIVDWEALAIRYKLERDAKDLKLESCRDELAELEVRSRAHIEELQKTVAELNQINSSLMTDKKILVEDKNALEAKIGLLEGTIQDISGENEVLSENLAECELKLQQEKAKKKLKDHGWLEFLWAKIGGV